nr:hypothetical protein [Tanacetum cinerariifolium]
MADFMPGRAVIDAAQRKRGKYMAKCAAIGYSDYNDNNNNNNNNNNKCARIEYDFLPFSFSSFGELEKDAVNLLKWIRKFSVSQDIRGRAAIHIFNMISFAIAKGVEAQLGLIVGFEGVEVMQCIQVPLPQIIIFSFASRDLDEVAEMGAGNMGQKSSQKLQKRKQEKKLLDVVVQDDGGGEALGRIYECLDVMDASTGRCKKKRPDFSENAYCFEVLQVLIEWKK